MRRPTHLVSALLLTLFVSACGVQSTTPTAPSTAPAAPAAPAPTPAPAPAPAPAEPLQAPLKSKQLNFYTAGPKGLADGLAAAFEKESGIKVNVFQAGTGEVLARLEAEKSNPQADVIVLADWSVAIGMKQDGLLQAYAAPEMATIPAQFKDAENFYAASGISLLGIAYNTKLVTTPPSAWTDLAAPDFAGAVTMPDPAFSGSAMDLVTGLMEKTGEDQMWSLFTQLKQGGLLVAGSNAQASNPVLTGARKAIFGAVDYLIYQAKIKGEPIDISYPTSGTVASPRPVMILKGAPNLGEGQRFVSFMLSVEGQKLIADQLIVPARSDVPADGRRLGMDQIKVLDVDHAWMNANKARIAERFATEITAK